MDRLNDSIANSLIQERSIDILGTVGDLALSSFADSKILENVPVLGMIQRLYNLGISISDRIFYKRVLHFLYELHRISMKDRAAMIAQLRIDDEHAKKTGDVLLEILNKCDDDRKASIIAKLFSDYILGYISFEKFNRFSRIVNQAYLFDLSNLRDYIGDSSLIGADVSLLSLGVIGIKTKTFAEGTSVSFVDSARSSQIEYYVNDNGRELFDAIENYI